jgi:hypothetical protein
MCPKEKDKMSNCETIPARHWLAFVETSEAKKLGLARRDDARPVVAARLKEAPGTLENLHRGRIKGLRHALVEKLRSEFIRAAEREVRQLENELAIARAGHGDLDFIEAREIAAHLEAVRAIVDRRKGVTNAAKA